MSLRFQLLFFIQSLKIQNKCFHFASLQSNFQISNVLFTFEFSSIKHFCSICLDGEKFEIEREIVTSKVYIIIIF